MSENGIPVTSSRDLATAVKLPELDTECGTCQGNGIVTTPEWLEWDKSEQEAEAYFHINYPGESWFGSQERMRWAEKQPEDVEMPCGDCDGKGSKPTAAGRLLLQFLRVHGRG